MSWRGSRSRRRSRRRRSGVPSSPSMPRRVDALDPVRDERHVVAQDRVEMLYSGVDHHRPSRPRRVGGSHLRATAPDRRASARGNRSRHRAFRLLNALTAWDRRTRGRCRSSSATPRGGHRAQAHEVRVEREVAVEPVHLRRERRAVARDPAQPLRRPLEHDDVVGLQRELGDELVAGAARYRSPRSACR